MLQTKYLSKFFLILALGFFIFFGLFRIGKFITTDEQFWVYRRIPQYWKALSEHDLRKTKINDKPGISLAIFSGFGMIFEKDPLKNHRFNNDKNFDRYNFTYTDKLHTYFRMPLIFINFLLLIYIFYIIKKITDNEWIAVWSVTFIGLFPILLGISRVINPDALLWSFSFCAAITYFATLKFPHEKKYLLATSFFMGLSILTKYVANILFPLFIIIIFLEYLIQFDKKFKKNYQETGVYFYSHLKNIITIFIGSIFVFSILMPSSLFRIKQLFTATIDSPALKEIQLPLLIVLFLIFIDARIFKGKVIYNIFLKISCYKKNIFSVLNFSTASLILFSLINWAFNQKFLDLSRIPVDSRSKDIFVKGASFFEKIILEFFPFSFTIPIITLIFFLTILLKNIFSQKKEYELYTVSTSILILIFFLGGIITNVLFTPRYDILLFPFIGFLASIGAHSVSKINLTKNIDTKILISIIIITTSFITLWRIKPFYYNFASAILPSHYTTNNTWGFGGYEAAEYLNSLPEAENITILVDYRGVCEFFKGNCIRNNPKSAKNFPIDYYVITKRGQSKNNFYLQKEFDASNQSPVWELFIDGRSENYVKIYKK